MDRILRICRLAFDDVYPAEIGKDNILLQGIVEADETYIGGKSRKDYDREETEQHKRGVAPRRMLS